MKGGLLTAWLAAVAIITYRGVKQSPRTTPLPMPLPSTYVSSFIIFGGLSLLPEEASTLASAMGWGLVVAMGLKLWNPNGTVAQNVTTASSPSTVPSSTVPTTATAKKGT